ncbi:MAG: cytochrome d ubiquinol oxidase subunit II [Chitinophagaceae bacterium]
MIYVVITFLWASILLYLLMGGADFGAGILELFTSRKNRGKTRRTLYQAIGPIWEANHMWLIIAIVILFVGFPGIYATMSVYLHIPLTVMLIGIIARGTAFTFRHYDAVVDEMQYVYNKIFVYSSFITPLFLGIIAASAVSGQINTNATSFTDAYIFSWLNLFSVAVGFFTSSICAYLAAIYLIGETKLVPEERQRFIVKARSSNIAALVSGVLVFIAAEIENIPVKNWVFGNLPGILAIALATASLILMWYLINKGRSVVIRVLAGFQVAMILFATTYIHYPNIVVLDNGYLSLIEHKGHDKTIQALGWALLLGSIFILPALFYLIYSFKRKKA